MDVNEGVRTQEHEHDWRRWQVTVRPATDAREEIRRDADNRKAAKMADQDADDRRRMLEALRRFPQGATLRAIREAAALNNDRGAKAIRTLIGEGRAEQAEILKNRRKETGYRPTGK